MSKLHFQSNSRPTLGIELELGLVDGRAEYVSWFGDKDPGSLFQVPVCVDPAPIPR